jgi:hypothetical protein
MNRCAKKIGEGVEIQDLASYAIGVGRMLVLEMNRARARAPSSVRRSGPESRRATERRIEYGPSTVMPRSWWSRGCR